jgi:hypothetical protein
MADDFIPEDVKQFILQNIDSIAQLECLLLLRGNPHVEWSVSTIARKLYVSEQVALDVLANLSAQALVSVKDAPAAYAYQPQDSGMDSMIGRLAELYSRYLIPVTHLIHSQHKNKIQQFADAFRIRKDPSDG